MNSVHLGDNLNYLKCLPSETIDLIYIDPPFNTGIEQKRKTQTAKRSDKGNVGFGGVVYQRDTVSELSYNDNISNYTKWLGDRLQQCHRVLKESGSIFVHLNWHEVYNIKPKLDVFFGEENFLNEIIWAWDYGAKSKRYFPRKHDNILWYSKSDKYYFNIEETDRIEYMAPDLVGEEKAKYGKLPTDVWWMSIVGTNSKEKTGYPNQKPVKLLERIIRTASKPGDLVLDFFAGSGTTGQACINLDRQFMLIDSNPEAIEVMKERFGENAKYFLNDAF
jgi:site-specific DNA-methyltransferase (adenine-specific)